MVRDYGLIHKLIMRLTRYSLLRIILVGQCVEKKHVNTLAEPRASSWCGQKTTLIKAK